MKTRQILKLFFCIEFLILVLVNGAWAQVASKEAGFADAALQNANREYKNRIGFQSLVFNGREYINYDNRINGHPYFESEYFEPGTLNYDGLIFDSVDMKYDVHRQLVIIRYYNEKGYGKDLAIPNENIDEFFLLNHHFIQIRDTSSAKILEPGFYDLLYNNEFTILSRRMKVYEEILNDRHLEKSFYSKDQFIILRDGEVSMVKNKRGILKALSDQKKELQKYIRKNVFDFRNDFENSLLLLAKYYSSLNN